MEDFFQEYCCQGIADDSVTTENYAEAENKLKTIKSSILDLGARLQEAREFLN